MRSGRPTYARPDRRRGIQTGWSRFWTLITGVKSEYCIIKKARCMIIVPYHESLKQNESGECMNT